MAKNTRFIECISINAITDFANKLTGRKGNPPINKELDYIAVYYRTYQGGHYDYEQSVRFNDFGYKIGNEQADIKEAVIWMKYVYKNLPIQYQKHYAKKCNDYSEKYLNESVFIIAKKEDYLLPENEELTQ